MKLKDQKTKCNSIENWQMYCQPRKKPKVEMVIIISVLTFLVGFLTFGLQDSTNHSQCGQYVVSEGFYLANYRITTYSIMRQTTMSSMPFAWLFRRQFLPYHSHRKGKFVHVKSVTVDVPCSRQLFAEKFVANLQNVQYCGQENFKCTLGPSDLWPVFGENWDYCKYPNSTTRRRIIGIIILHFRKKLLVLNNTETNIR